MTSPSTRKGFGRKFPRSGCRRKTWERWTPARRLSPQKSRSSTNWADVLTRGFGSVSQALLAASFVPFLVYFMLSWQHHVRSATVMLFSLENRHAAYVTLGLISAMIRSFMVGNLLIGLFLGTAGTIAFAILHVPFFYFIGFISGFLSLVPYLGVVLAMAPPIFVSVGHINSGDAVVIVLTVLVLHLIALNVLYPKFLGNRLQLNPLAVTIALAGLGMALGSDGPGPGRSHHGRHENRLRPRGVAEAVWGVDGGVRQSAVVGLQSSGVSLSTSAIGHSTRDRLSPRPGLRRDVVSDSLRALATGSGHSASGRVGRISRAASLPRSWSNISIAGNRICVSTFEERVTVWQTK